MAIVANQAGSCLAFSPRHLAVFEASWQHLLKTKAPVAPKVSQGQMNNLIQGFAAAPGCVMSVATVGLLRVAWTHCAP